MRVSIVVARSFDDLPAAYAALFELDSLPFDQTLIWYRAFADRVLANSDEMYIAGFEHDGEPVAVLPLHVVRGPGPITRFNSLANYYTSSFGPIIRPGADRAAVLSAIAAELTASLPGWHSLDINPMDSGSEDFAGLARGLRSASAHVVEYFRAGNWILNVAGRSFDEYFTTIPGQVRNTVRRKGRKLKRLESRTRICSAPSEVDGALARYEQVYEKSWKQVEPYRDFIREVAHRFAERGWLRLGLVEIDKQPAAAQIWFVHNGVASIFKLAYDEDYAKYSAGSILTAELMRHAIDTDRVHRVDYLFGDDAYKRDWMSERREKWALRAYNRRSVTGLVAAAAAKLRALLPARQPGEA